MSHIVRFFLSGNPAIPINREAIQLNNAITTAALGHPNAHVQSAICSKHAHERLLAVERKENGNKKKQEVGSTSCLSAQETEEEHGRRRLSMRTEENKKRDIALSMTALAYGALLALSALTAAAASSFMRASRTRVAERELK